MATTDVHHIVGSLVPSRAAAVFLGGAVDDAIQIDTFAAGRVTANDTKGTFTAWINVPDITGTYAVISCGDASAVEYISLSVVAGKIRIVCTDATVLQYSHASTSVVLKPHVWHHIALVQDGVDAVGNPPLLYVDGVRVATTMTDETDNGTWFDDCALLDGASIGAAEDGGDGGLTDEFKGAISDVKYWNTNLSDAQILDDYKGKALTTNLVAHWDMKDDFVESVTGYSGTKVGDVILSNAYSEFTSRLRHTPSALAVVADKIVLSCDRDIGHAIIIKAA